MRHKLVAACVLAAWGQLAQAEVLAVSGTAAMYGPGGMVVGPLLPITGSYDTDLMHVTIDPWMFFGSLTYSEIDLLEPGTHVRPGAGTVTVSAGQLGGFIQTDWGVNVDLPAFIVWDVVSYPGGMHFEPVDSDGDGVLGHAMISYPFPGFSIVYEFDVGAPAPAVDVSLTVLGGTRQECDTLGGKNVSVMATVDLGGGAVLGSIDWTVDGEAVGTGNSITPFLTLGSHTVEVTATTTEGLYDTAVMAVNVVDTTRPDLSIAFVDTRTGLPVTAINGAGASYVEIRLNASDICDGDVDVLGVAKPVYAVMGGEVIKIQGNTQSIDMSTTAIEVSATATDDDGNKQIDQSILPINP